MTIESKILSWCRAAPKNRTLGMRTLREAPGGEVCVVLYLDTFGGAFVSEYGSPVRPLRWNTSVVRASGRTWEEVAAKLGIE